MPHVALVPLTGFRLREPELLALGMQLPGLRQRAQAIAQLPALGLLTLAGLNPPHWTCSYHELPRVDEAAVESILATRPALVAVSALTASMNDAYALSALLRRHRVPVVLGGLHATACPEEAQQHVDAVVVGEGEPVWRQVLADVEAGRLQPRYQATKVFDLATAPMPRFDLLGTKRRPRLTLQTQRGCPLACEFCGASRLLGSFREKPVDRLREEIGALRTVDPHPQFELADDNTFAGQRAAGELLDALAEARGRWFTEVDWRLGERPDLLRQLAAAGCVQVLIGIESPEFRFPGMGPKQADLRRIMDAVAAIQEAGVCVIGCFIIGADGETQASLDRLIEFVLASPLADVQITIQTPFPGTPLRRRLKSQGRLLPDRDWSAYTLFDVAYKPDPLSAAELEAGFQRVVQAVFAPWPSARRNEVRESVWRGHLRLD
jgi:radical SAM superfamily enzyme YgiQ (UPF0313 family)